MSSGAHTHFMMHSRIWRKPFYITKRWNVSMCSCVCVPGATYQMLLRLLHYYRIDEHAHTHTHRRMSMGIVGFNAKQFPPIRTHKCTLHLTHTHPHPHVCIIYLCDFWTIAHTHRLTVRSNWLLRVIRHPCNADECVEFIKIFVWNTRYCQCQCQSCRYTVAYIDYDNL